MFDLSGKTALVTGASGGIGGAIARVLHGAGAFVILTGTREEPLQALKNELKDRCEMVVCRLDDHEQIEALAKKASDIEGGVDILVNNAGITRDNLLMRMKDDEWLDVINVNLTSPVFLSRALMRSMMKKKWGRIINIASVVGVAGNAGQANYASAKAGLISFSKSLAREIASRGVTVNCVAPGYIQTAMTDKLSDDVKDKIVASIPVGRQGNVDEIAAAVLYLSSQEASFVTGETLNVNGGQHMV